MDLFDKYCSTNWVEVSNCGDKLMTDIGLRKGNIDGVPTGIMDEWRH